MLQDGSPSYPTLTHLFHALGGDDVRDGFDYVFERRKRGGHDFIAVAHTDGPGGDHVHAGRYGDASYFGISPRPHDLYLEEVWDFDNAGELGPAKPSQGAWFAATSIRDLYFRDLPSKDKHSGRTFRLGRTGIEEAIRAAHNEVAREIARALSRLGLDLRSASQRSTY